MHFYVLPSRQALARTCRFGSKRFERPLGTLFFLRVNRPFLTSQTKLRSL